jgi:hypothetical protein
LCHEKTRDLFLLKALDFVLASADSYSKLGERSQVAIATIILNASIIAWKQRGPESLSSKCCHILLLLLQQKIASSAALIRLLGAVGTNVFLVHCVNSREDGVTWNVEPAILLQSLDISFKSDEKVSHVVGELKAAFELPL